MISCIYQDLKIEVAKQGQVSGDQLEALVAIQGNTYLFIRYFILYN